jgi:hypothetical protein
VRFHYTARSSFYHSNLLSLKFFTFTSLCTVCVCVLAFSGAIRPSSLVFVWTLYMTRRVQIFVFNLVFFVFESFPCICFALPLENLQKRVFTCNYSWALILPNWKVKCAYINFKARALTVIVKWLLNLWFHQSERQKCNLSMAVDVNCWIRFTKYQEAAMSFELTMLGALNMFNSN